MTQEEFIKLCAHGDYVEMTDTILDEHIDVNKPAIINGYPAYPMFIAASSGNLEAVEVLSDFNADCTDGFIAATVAGNTKILDFLVKFTDADINALDRGGSTALITAVTMNSPEMVDKLIELGADVNVRSKGGSTALTFAAMMAAEREGDSVPAGTINPRIIAALIKNGAEYGEAMYVAMKTESDDFADAVLDAGVDPNLLDDTGRTMLMHSVMHGGGLMRTLLKHGADPNIPDKLGRTPLMIAVIDDETDPAVIDTLLEFGADINAHDQKGITALMWAVVSADKNPNVVMPALIRTGGLRAKGWELWCAFLALYAAAKREIQLDRVRQLIRAGADVNALDNSGMNAIMYALVQGDDTTADILSDAGATINFDIT